MLLFVAGNDLFVREGHMFKPPGKCSNVYTHFIGMISRKTSAHAQNIQP